MFKQKGQATKRGKVWTCKVCGAKWKSTGKHKITTCLICRGLAWCEKHEIRIGKK
jgi:hypothetical protein